jgi:hypothetical protein
MATTVGTIETLQLDDGKEVTIKALPIATLNRFLEEWRKIADTETEDDSTRVLINCCGIALYKRNFADDYASKPKKDEEDEGAVLAQDYYDYLSENLDMPTIYRIMKVAGDLDIDPNDPKVQAALARVMEAQENLGTTSTS